MKKTFALAGRGLAWLTVFNMTFSSLPGLVVHAEDMMTESYASDETEDTAVSSVFTITSFPDYKKTDDGRFEKEKIQERYGNMKADAGTPFEMLEFPSSITIEGYWEYTPDEPDAFTLEDISWMLKSDTGETYTEDSPAGTYTFVPDLDTWLYMQDGSEEPFFEELKLADGLKLPAITLEIVAEETETETESDTAFETETLPVSETEPIVESETDYVPATETDDVPQTETMSETETDDILQTDFMPATEPDTETESFSEEDIFSGMDDSLINAEDAVVINDEYVSGNSETTTVPETESDENDSGSESESQDLTEMDSVDLTETDTQEADSGDSTESDGIETDAPNLSETDITEADTSGSGETEPATIMTEEDDPAALSETDDTEESDEEINSEKEDLIVTISISDGQNSYSYIDSETNNTVTLSADSPEVSNDAEIIVPCNSELNMQALAVTFMDATHTEVYSFFPGSDNYQDFRAEATKDFIFYPDTADDTLSYTVHLTVLKNQHTWGTAATCTTPQLCTICGAENPDAPATGHDLTEATCTHPATCNVCGWTDGVLLPHDWIPATCTDPKTCALCGATSGKKLGHKLGDWETVKNSTETEHGEAVRYCEREDCDFSETKPLNIIGDPANNVITNLVDGETYKLKEILSFRAVGAGMGNTRPIDGDIRYVPSSWKIQNTPGSFMDNYTGSFSITAAGSYTLTVTFQKQIFSDGWQVTDIADSKSITFNVGTLVQGTPVTGSENGIRINPKTGDSTMIAGFVIAIVAAVIVLIIALIFKKRKRR
ncbi:MAG: LPXTG cell wall anchor domain-containing protein [Eubacteriales bacterium]|nr:LPXTG cell wall anchor domain-containing protein [Eubacteriales bacterium]